MATIAAGCGGGGASPSEDGSSSTADSTAASGNLTSPEDSPAGPDEAPASEGLNAEPSREFLGSGQNGRLATIGKESGDTERQAASRALEEFLKAGEAGDWATQCSLLAASSKEQIEKAAQPLGDVDCPAALKSQAERAPASARANTMTGPIDAFRINQGLNGFAFYHGTGARDYVIPMIDQDGWKVVALRAEPIE